MPVGVAVVLVGTAHASARTVQTAANKTVPNFYLREHTAGTMHGEIQVYGGWGDGCLGV